MPRRKWRGELCAYCGVRPATTTDHVVAQCLFPSKPDFWPTVPACKTCHDTKSKHEEYLREVLVADIAASEHPVARAILDGPVVRAVEKNRSRIARTAVTSSKVEAVHTQRGIYLGHYPTVPIEAERVNVTLKMIVQGLYFSIRKMRVLANYAFEVRRVPPWNVRDAIQDMQQLLPGDGPRLLGDRVFACYFRYADADEFLTIWLLGF